MERAERERGRRGRGLPEMEKVWFDLKVVLIIKSLV